MRSARWFLPVYAASGAAALIYEVAWTRLLTLHVGHGVAAAATVLAAFMGGLAIGAAVAGQVGDRLVPARALRTYAALEAAVGVLALLLPFELAALQPLLRLAYADGGGAAFALLRLVSSLLLVAVPAAAMGATFPLAARWYVPRAAQATAGAGALYTVNTIGAAAGAVLAGFVLLPSLGLAGTTWVGVALNALVAAAAWGLAAAVPSPAESAPAAPPAGATAAPAPAGKEAKRKARAPLPAGVPARVPQPLLAAMTLGVSGFASLTLQVVWTRLLALILGPTTYAFSAVVAVFIAGIAVGAAAGTWLAARLRQPAAGLAVCLALAVGAGAAAAWRVDWALFTMADGVAARGATFDSVLFTQVALIAALLAPMAIAFGAAFPFGVAAGTGRDATVVADLGLLYTLNTIGAIAGSLLAGFVFVRAFGLHGTIRLVTAIGGLAALAVVAVARPRGAAGALAGGAALAALGLAVVVPAWNPALLSSGAYKYAPQMQGQEDLGLALAAGRLLYYREGATATVAVRDAAGTTSLSIDGKVDASNSGDMLTQRLLAHVPLLLHPAPRAVAILGLGSGVTLGAALTHPIAQADVLEISPEVVDAARFFAPENHDALADERTRVVVGDGRTHLLLSRQVYDVIISEPSNPWMAGIASLFTREFFAAARARLAPGGVLCQWAHTYDMSAADLRSIVATFQEVFPDGTLWLLGDGDVLLVGSTEPLGPRMAAVASHWTRSGVAADLAGVGVRAPFSLLSLFVAAGQDLRAFAEGAPVQRDDRASLEFSGPRSVFGGRGDDNSTALRALQASSPAPPAVAQARAAAGAPEWRDRGWMQLRAGAAREAWDDFRRALDLDPRDREAWRGLLEASPSAGRQDETSRLVAALAASPDNVEAQLARSRFLATTGNYPESVAAALAVVERDPANVDALEQLASVLLDVSDRERLVPVVTRLRTIAPSSDAARYYTAALLFLEGRAELAVREAQALVAGNPTHARAQNLLGAALGTLGNRDAARDALLASLKLEPRDATTYTNLGMLELEAGRRELALQRFSEALTLNPGSATARDGLSKARGAR